MAVVKTKRKSTKKKSIRNNGTFDISQLPYKFKLIDLKKLKPHPEQSDTREITAEALEGLKGSLAENIVEEISYNKRTGHIISGHQRCKALIEMGRAKVPVKVWDVDQDTEDLMFYNMNNQQIAGRFTPLAVDRISELNIRLGDRAEAVGLKMLEVELQAVHGTQAKEGLTDPDDVPATPKEAKTKTGDLYQLGSHRLLCGDATKKEDVERLMGGEKADMVFTDPPYGIGKDIQNDELTGDKFDDFNTDWIAAIPVGLNASLVCYHSTRTFPSVLTRAVCNGWEFERMLWFYRPDKFPVHVWNGWMMVSQAIMLFTRGQIAFAKVSPADQDTYRCTVKDLGDGSGHPTEKIVAQCISMMQHVSGSIYDPFLGSGTTMIACEQLDRKCFGMEIDELYCDVIVKRWEDFTGKTAVLLEGA